MNRLADRPMRAEVTLAVAGAGSSVAVVASAAAATAFTALRLAVGAVLAPMFYFIFLRALDAPLAHLLIVFNLSLRKLSVLPEDYVEAQTEYAKAYENNCCK